MVVVLQSCLTLVLVVPYHPFNMYSEAWEYKVVPQLPGSLTLLCQTSACAPACSESTASFLPSAAGAAEKAAAAP